MEEAHMGSEEVCLDETVPNEGLEPIFEISNLLDSKNMSDGQYKQVVQFLIESCPSLKDRFEILNQAKQKKVI